MKSIIYEFFYAFGWLSFCLLFMNPVFDFFINKKIELSFFPSIEILDYKKYIFDIVWLALGAGLLAFLRIKHSRDKKTPKAI